MAITLKPLNFERIMMNPYNVLNIDQNADKQDIVHAVTLAMRERKYSSREIAVAQKKLMETVSRAAEEFVCFIDVTPFLDQLGQTLPETRDQAMSEIPVSDADLNYLPLEA